MSNPAQQLEFDESAKLISEGKFAEAQDKLLQLRAQNVTSPGLESNLARSLMEKGHLGHSVWHYMIAVRLDRFDTQARRDLALAQSRVEGGVGLAMKDPAEWGYSLSTYLLPSEALSLASLTLLAALFLKVLDKVSRKALIVLAVVGVLFAGMAALGGLGRSIYIVGSDANLRREPLDSSEVVQPVKGGARVKLIRRSGDFSEIERTDSLRGWIHAKDLLRAP